MRRCPICESESIYQYNGEVEYSGVGEELLPKLGKGIFGVATLRPSVCGECGHVMLIASDETIEKLKESEHWKRF